MVAPSVFFLDILASCMEVILKIIWQTPTYLEEQIGLYIATSFPHFS
jgi:hypothetical protein